MNRSRWLFNAILILIFSILALVSSLFLYIYWYIGVSTGLKAVVKKFNIDPTQVLSPQTWVVILVLSILMGFILILICIIFIYNLKSFQLFRLQRNFISNFTHELKTPVTSLKLYLETFFKYELPRPDQLKYIKYMLADIERLSNNINSILSTAQIEIKNLGGQVANENLIDVIEQFLTKNGHLFKNCRIQLHYHKKDEFDYIINRLLFEMLIMNLINNGIKYNDSDKPSVDIFFKMTQNDLRLSFVDNGIGIEKKHTKKIFKKFFQVGTADNRTAKGSGLGLYLVAHIAKIHKGKIIAESNGIGKGSTFTLTLPITDENQKA